MAHQSEGKIDVAIHNGIKTLTLNNPDKLNALTTTMMAELTSQFRQSDSDADTRVVIVTGSGEKAFSAGLDIFGIETMGIMELRAFPAANQELYRALTEINKPVISAVNGITMGSALEISLLSDMTVASSNTKFSMPELAVGAYPGVISVAMLFHLIGKKRATDLLLAGRTIDAEEALGFGLINEVVWQDQVRTRSIELAEKFASQGPIPLAMAKARINALTRTMIEEELGHFVEAQTLCFMSDDFQEGRAALNEHRKPVFCGK